MTNGAKKTKHLLGRVREASIMNHTCIWGWENGVPHLLHFFERGGGNKLCRCGSGKGVERLVGRKKKQSKNNKIIHAFGDGNGIG